MSTTIDRADTALPAPSPSPELDRTLAAFDRVLFDAAPATSDLARLDPETGRGERFLLYRELVRSRLRDLVATALPRTTAVIGRAAMDREVEARLSRAAPTTRFFREVATEIVDPSAPGLASDAHPELDDLARLELAQWRAMYVDPPTPATREFDFAARPVVTPTMQRLRLTHSVHLVDRPLSRGSFHVFVYRRRDHVIETRWMNDALAAILDRWIAGEGSAIDAVRAAMSSLGREPTPEIVDAMSGLLAELLERGGMLGSRP
jgi:hypothetical protein